jgi:transcriptional regulator with XRE-family HTH domain
LVNKTEIGARVVDVRGSLKQGEFATRIGVHKNTVGRIERGEYAPDGEFLQALCQEFGISPTWVLTGQEPKHVPAAVSVGLLMSDAIAKSPRGFSIEQQRSLGADDDTFCAYLSGAQMPDIPFLERFSALTGYALERLVAARQIGEAMASMETVAAQIQVSKMAREQTAGLADHEQMLIDQYRATDEKGKYLIECACAAVASPTLSSWMRLGQAMSDASNSIEKKK